MVVGPAGFGKTVLLSAWLEQSSAKQLGAVRWKYADDGVDLSEVLLSAAGMRPATHEPVAGGQSDADYVAMTLSELQDHEVPEGQRPDLLVLDDAHLLPPRDIELISAVLVSRPDAVRLMVASRRDLPLPVFELELRGEASVIRAEELRFTESESEQLVRRHLGDVSDKAVKRLGERAAGWAAALVLGSRAVSGVEDEGALLRALGRTDEPIVDFLLGDAFQGLPAVIRALLLSTYEERHLTARRAEVLSGQSNAGVLLSELAADGLLVTAYPVDEGHEFLYAYHPLLVELLRRRTTDPDTNTSAVPEAHHRAALSHAAHGEEELALLHASGSHDIELIIRMVMDHGPAVIVRGEVDALSAAYAALPDDVLERYPALTGVTGLYRRLIGDHSGSVSLAARAAEVADIVRTNSIPPSIDRDAVHADSLILQLWQTHFGLQDLESTIEAARRALGCVPKPAHQHRPMLVLSPDRQSWLMLELAAAEIWAGELDMALAHVDGGLAAGRLASNDALIASAMGHRALIELVNGNARAAADSATACLKHADRVTEGWTSSDHAHLVLAWVAYIRLDFKEAADRLTGMSPAAGAHSSAVVVQVMRILLQSALMTEHDEIDDSQRLLVDPVGTGAALPGFLVRSLSLFRWTVATAAGDRTTAQTQVDVLRLSGFPAEAELLTAVDLLKTARLEEALVHAERSIATPGPLDPATRACAATARTAILLRQGDNEAARLAIIDVLSQCAPQELLYVLTIGLEAGPDFLDLLSDESGRVGAHPFAATALDALMAYVGARVEEITPSDGAQPALDGDRPQPQGRPPEPPLQRRSVDVMIHGVHITLTERELDVLAQLALGSSYNEIGAALYITENTVKTHLTSLYRKLGVERKSAALRVARELALL